MYLPSEWHAAWEAPTVFLDPPSGEELHVPVAPGRLVIMDQDVSHKVTAPTAAAGARPRYSLVLKLVLHPPRSCPLDLEPEGGTGSVRDLAPRSVRLGLPEWSVTKVGSARACDFSS